MYDLLQPIYIFYKFGSSFLRQFVFGTRFVIEKVFTDNDISCAPVTSFSSLKLFAPVIRQDTNAIRSLD